jgi:predicted membrane protein
MARSCRSFSWTFLIGALILGAGVVLLLDQQGIVSADRIFNYFWPGVLIAAGVVTVVDARGRGSRALWGYGMWIFGVLLVLSNLGIGHFRFETIWPVLIIGVGVLMIWQAVSGPSVATDGSRKSQWLDYVNPWSRSGNDDSDLNHVAIFGGFNKRSSTQTFRGGKLIALCGGWQVDLRKAEMEGDTVVIEAVAVMGGGEIKVPEHWQVSMDGVGIFGGYSDESSQQPPAPGAPVKKLIVKGVAILGGVVVKN